MQLEGVINRTNSCPQEVCNFVEETNMYTDLCMARWEDGLSFFHSTG